VNRRPGGWPVIVIGGPTGVGKTEVALEVARRLSGEVLSADSRQIYQKLIIGTAKPKGKWCPTAEGPRYVVQGVVHHLLDHVPPTETYTAGRFTKEAMMVLEELSQRNVPAILVGGTGMYLRALVRGLAPLPEADPTLRKELTERAEKEGREVLHKELAEVDPFAAQTIPPNNLQRVIRALEVHRITGRALSFLQKELTSPAPWDFSWYGLRWDPATYQTHLKIRCRSMGEGLIAETKGLLAEGLLPSAPAFQSLGYREAIAYETGKITRDEFENAFNRQTHLYAKRQLTWFRGEPAIRWLDVAKGTAAQRVAEQLLSQL
jgi:tRNA dimethylallyltransferase